LLFQRKLKLYLTAVIVEMTIIMKTRKARQTEARQTEARQTEARQTEARRVGALKQYVGVSIGRINVLSIACG
jgi:hypothetical protein